MKKVLIANRGEIAARVVRGCKLYGVPCVALTSRLEKSAPYWREADEVFELEGKTLAETYLSIEKIVEALEKTGADAVHPGYGFISESTAFVEAVEALGVAFIGPTAASMELLGRKDRARDLAQQLNIPVVPGSHGASCDCEFLAEEAERIGFPILVKAAGGGGGRGMRIVSSAAKLSAAVESAMREAGNAFGNSALLLERFIEKSRHIEVQIIGDGKGKVIHLGERDCSLQRRQQKVVEEAPSYKLSQDTLSQLLEHAVALGKAARLRSAATVEFLLTNSNEVYFLEVNPRIQVEHPVTEIVTGIDIVSLQLEIAETSSFTLDQSAVRLDGHAIEARIYAEAPGRHFVPTCGWINQVSLPEGENIRTDHALFRGIEVSSTFDSLLCKVIVRDEDRTAAIASLECALRGTVIEGVGTNLSLLQRLLQDEALSSGSVHTRFIEERLESYGEIESDQRLVLCAAYFTSRHGMHDSSGQENRGESLPFRRLRRELGDYPVSALSLDSNLLKAPLEILPKIGKIELMAGGEGWQIVIDGILLESRWITKKFCEVRLAEQIYRIKLERQGGNEVTELNLGGVRFTIAPRMRRSSQGGAEIGKWREIVAPLPGTIRNINVKTGQLIKAGEPLLVLESMKIEHLLESSCEGIVRTLKVEQSSSVRAGDVLLVYEAIDRENGMEAEKKEA